MIFLQNPHRRGCLLKPGVVVMVVMVPMPRVIIVDEKAAVRAIFVSICNSLSSIIAAREGEVNRYLREFAELI